MVEEDALTCVYCSKFFVDAHDKLVECVRCTCCLKFMDAKYQLLSEFITRLGRKTDGPMKVIMTCEADKIRVIDRINDLRRSTEEADKETVDYKCKCRLKRLRAGQLSGYVNTTKKSYTRQWTYSKIYKMI